MNDERMIICLSDGTLTDRWRAESSAEQIALPFSITVIIIIIDEDEEEDVVRVLCSGSVKEAYK